MTLAELRRVQRACERTVERYREVHQRRDEAIRLAIAEGMTHAQIAEATGLSRGRVGQIAST